MRAASDMFVFARTRTVTHGQVDVGALRLVGDPAQHSAVATGRACRALLDEYPEDRVAAAGLG